MYVGVLIFQTATVTCNNWTNTEDAKHSFKGIRMQASSPVCAMHVARFGREGVQTALVKVLTAIFHINVVDQSIEE